MSDSDITFAPLPASFYEPGAEVVGPALLGHLLIRKTAAGFCGGMIVETEAYLTEDPASHGFKGRTVRNAAMFGPAGTAYVYFIYGNHWCFNVACQREGVAEAVLIRAVEPRFGIGWMQVQRPVVMCRELTNGPAKLCAALGIDRRMGGVSLFDADSPVFIADNPRRQQDLSALGPEICTTRIGITKAADLPLRFYLGSSEFVSRRSARRLFRRSARQA